jgi:hypothetical protein
MMVNLLSVLRLVRGFQVLYLPLGIYGFAETGSFTFQQNRRITYADLNFAGCTQILKLTFAKEYQTQSLYHDSENRC